jgi:hypothetical protein
MHIRAYACFCVRDQHLMHADSHAHTGIRVLLGGWHAQDQHQCVQIRISSKAYACFWEADMLKININVCRFANALRHTRASGRLHAQDQHQCAQIHIHTKVLFIFANKTQQPNSCFCDASIARICHVYMCIFKIHASTPFSWYMNECIDCGHIFHLHTCKCAEKHLVIQECTHSFLNTWMREISLLRDVWIQVYIVDNMLISCAQTPYAHIMI